MSRFSCLFVITVMWLPTSWAATVVSQPINQKFDAVSRGEALVKIAGCTDCHSTNFEDYMGGGVKLTSAFGNFYTPNISSDPNYGIGNWSFDDFFNAMRYGKRRDGSLYYPVFPYRAYTQLADRDIRYIYEYLKTVPPVKKRNREHELKFPFRERELLLGWQTLYFSAGTPDVDFSKSPSYNRGAYLVEALAHCTECHTPRTSLGGLEKSQWMAGSAFNVPGAVAPNITPDVETGLGRWSVNDWRRFLSSGILPNFKTVGGEMADVIQNTSALSPRDRDDIIEYMRSLKPVYHWADEGKR